jgi:hypothetical protein
MMGVVPPVPVVAGVTRVATQASVGTTATCNIRANTTVEITTKDARTEQEPERRFILATIIVHSYDRSYFPTRILTTFFGSD